MTKTKHDIAKDVMTAVNSIEALKDKINQLAEYATQLTENPDILQVEISFEDTHPDHPFTIRPLFETLGPIQFGMPPTPNPEKPIGYQKIFPAGMPLSGEFHALVPTHIVLKIIDFFMTAMKQELASYEYQIDKSITTGTTEVAVMTTDPDPIQGTQINYIITPSKKPGS